jgi:hypothetical protein
MSHNFFVTTVHCVLLMPSMNMAAVMELYHIGSLHFARNFKSVFLQQFNFPYFREQSQCANFLLLSKSCVSENISQHVTELLS